MNHPIWQIGLFKVTADDKNIVECLECKEKSLNYLLKISQRKKYEHLQRGTLSVLDKKIVNFSVCCDIPFLVINHPTFKTLVRNQSENLRDESHYRKKALPEVYKIVKDKVKSEVTAMDQIRFTTDIWTSDTTKDAFIRTALLFR
uniref:DUF659 domain-containing protein n=1 Tax=Globodera pallida TaxID=36090 RepID=A0A183C537_GLOPA